MASEDGKQEELRIMLVGDTGSGKSATGNTILRKRAFTTRQSRVPETLTCQAESGEFEGTPVSVVDTPFGIICNVTEMSKCTKYCATGPHAFLVVISLKRFNTVERHLKILHRLFGEEASRHSIVLFTCGDELPDGVTTEELIHQHPGPSGVEYHVLNNRDEDPTQVRELLKKIKRMAQKNGGEYCIKVKDWKDKYLYPLASAVTVGGAIGTASGGTGGGVLVAALGSAVGAFAARTGKSAVVVSIAIAFAVGLAVAIGADYGTGLVIAYKAAAAIASGAGAFGTFDDIDVGDEALLGIIGGAGVGAGVSMVVREYAAMVSYADYIDFLYGSFTCSLGVIIVLFALVMIVFEDASGSTKIAVSAIVAGVSIGAAFGAAVGVLGPSGCATGAMITITCLAVTCWLKQK